MTLSIHKIATDVYFVIGHYFKWKNMFDAAMYQWWEETHDIFGNSYYVYVYIYLLHSWNFSGHLI